MKNIYFLFLLVWRAVVKAGPYWQQEGFFTGNGTEDTIVKKCVEELLLQSRSVVFQLIILKMTKNITLEQGWICVHPTPSVVQRKCKFGYQFKFAEIMYKNQYPIISILRL